MNSVLSRSAVTAPLDDPFYYLANFRFVLAWVSEHYADLLTPEERAFSANFAALPQPSQALLVRMVMRKGELFRTDKLDYVEIGNSHAALGPLVEVGWLENDPTLTFAELFRLLRLTELRQALTGEIERAGLSPRIGKAALGEALEPHLTQQQRLNHWWPEAMQHLAGACVVRLTLMPWCDRMRLMFFGNLRQEWAEFVLAELGLQRFERVELTPASRAFHSRTEVDVYLKLHDLRERLSAGELPACLEAEVPQVAQKHAWLDQRRGRLLFHLGQAAERGAEPALALRLYTASGDGPQGQVEARIRRLRLLERLGEYRQAYDLARQSEKVAAERERQALARLLPRLGRRLGLTVPAQAPDVTPQRLDLCLPRRYQNVALGVERAVAEHLGCCAAPVYYVENTLLTGLFGLLCWPALFAPLPGAFFHPFHAGPADLYRDDFVSRRYSRFAACLAQLDEGSYCEAIRQVWREKRGITSPFVHWDALDEPLLELALACLPAAHLRACFERLLADLKDNRAGLPDLIQFHPGDEEGLPRYRWIEVKGPGDRLQDNQRRWLAFFEAQGIEAVVCHVTWQQDAA